MIPTGGSGTCSEPNADYDHRCRTEAPIVRGTMRPAQHGVRDRHLTDSLAGALWTSSRGIASQTQFRYQHLRQHTTSIAWRNANLAHPAGRKHVRYDPSVRSLVNQPRKQLRLVHAPPAPERKKAVLTGTGAARRRRDLGPTKQTAQQATGL